MPGAMAPDYVRGHGIRAVSRRVRTVARPGTTGYGFPYGYRHSRCRTACQPCPLPRLMPAIEDFPHPVPASRRAAPVLAAGRRPRGVAERRRAIFGGHWAANARKRSRPHVRWRLYCYQYYMSMENPPARRCMAPIRTGGNPESIFSLSFGLPESETILCRHPEDYSLNFRNPRVLSIPDGEIPNNAISGTPKTWTERIGDEVVEKEMEDARFITAF